MRRVLIALGFLWTVPAFGQTAVPAGNLVGSQTWSLAGSPYVLGGDVTVPSGITLSIEAGVTVRLGPGDSLGSGNDSARTELRVAGTLAVAGTAGAPVVLTSGAGSPATGDHYGLVLLAGSTVNVTSLEVRYGTRGVHSAASGAVISDLRAISCTTGVEVVGGSMSLGASSVRQSGSYGVYVNTGGALTATGLTVESSASYGAYCFGATCSFTGSVFRNNASRGLYFRTDVGTFTQSVSKSTVYGNGSYGVYVVENGGTLSSTVRDNVIVNNGSYGVYVSGSPSMIVSNNLTYGQTTAYNNVSAGSGALNENPLLVDAANGDFRPTSRSGARMGASDGGDIGAFAYDGAITPQLMGHVFQSTTLTAAASPHDVVGDLTVEPGVTLTIEPGATLRFAAGTDGMGANADTSRVELRVRGTLLADGTNSLGISLVSSAGSPAAGDWYGVMLLAGSTASILDYATVRHARYGVHGSTGPGSIIQRSTIEGCASNGVYVDAGSLELAELLVRNNSSYGVYYFGASGIIRGSRIYDNGSRGIYLRTDVGTHDVQVYKNTLTGNGSYGIYVVENGGTLSSTVRDNLIVNNGSYGVYVSGSPSMTVSNNLVWGQATAYNNVSAGSGAIAENPLVVDATARDMRLTSNSPARNHASDLADIGALAFDGAPTVGVQGHLYDATSWSGTVDVLGDVTVEPGATLSIAAGTVVRFATSDSMAGNTDTSKVELLVRGRIVADGTPGARISLGSAAVSPVAGDWYGVELTASAASSTLDNVVIQHARYGVHSQAPASAVLSQSEVARSSSYGLYLDGGALTVDGVSVHDNASYGVYAFGSSPTLTNLLAYSNGSRGVYARTDVGTQTVTIQHATLWGNGSYGVYAVENGGTLNVTLRNSIISENGAYGVYVSGSPSMSLSNNDVWGQTTAYNNVSAGPNSIAANPQYVNTGLGNFHLLPNSPAIDAAAAGAVASDLDGVSRPIDGDMNGNAVADMGAFEFNPSANRWPIADAGADRVVTSNVQATFSAAGSVDPDGMIVQYVWDFGDGTPQASGLTVNHTFTGGTDRIVTLTITDNGGATDTDTVNVEVNLPPTADAGADRFADPAEVVTFSASGSTDADGTISNYHWSFGDGAQGNGVTVTHAYLAGGNYTVTLTITDDDGATASDTTTAHITGADGAPPSISHTPVAAGRPLGQPVVVSADVTDSSGIQSATLYYRATGGGAFASLAMSNVGGASYQATIPGGAVTAAGVDYYLSATDASVARNTATSPAGAPASFHAFTVNAPTPPSITHVPVGNGQLSGQPVSISANVMAASGVAAVRLYHRAQGGGAFAMVPMSAGAGTSYLAQIPGNAVSPPGVEYYLEVVDLAVPPVTVTHPTSGVHGFTVTPADGAAPVITHTPIAGGQPEGQAVTVSANVTDATGIASVSLYYRVAGGGAFASTAMSAAGGGNYGATIPANVVTRAGVDYYLSATDSASPANTGTSPAGAPGAFHTFTVTRTFTVSAGDVIISEVMNDPNGTETQREWFELYNTTASPIDLSGFELLDDGTDSFTIGAALSIPAHGYLVLGRSSDTALNGGVTVDHVYTGFALSNTADELVLRAGGLVVDRVAYDASFPSRQGHSMSLDPTTLDAASNDDGTSWCAATSALSGGDFGTPGAANDPCQAPPDTTPPSIVHTRIADGQQAGAAVTVSALVTDATGVGAVELFHRPATGGAFTRVVMADGGGGSYQGVLPGAAVTTAGVQYYLRAVDTAATPNEAFEPAAGQAGPHTFLVTSTDGSGPTITHSAITGPQPANVALLVRAAVSDASGVLSATLYYRSGAGAFTSAAMTQVTANDFEASIPAGAVQVPSVEYYLEAVDGSPGANRSSFPAGGMAAPIAVSVAAVDRDPPAITHTPVSGAQPAGRAVAITAEVSDPSGVAEVLVYFRAAGGASFVSAPLAMMGGGQYAGEIPAALVAGAGVDYYLEATDASPDDNRARLPAGAPGAVFSFTVDPGMGGDVTPPTILHLAIADGRSKGSAVEIVAEIVDPSGVAEAKLAYRLRGGSGFTEVALARQPGSDRYVATIPGEAVQLPAVEYYLEATDASAAANRGARPQTAPAELFAFTVVEPAGPGPQNPEPIERDSGGCATGGAGLEGVLAVLLGLALARRRRES